MVLKPFSTTGPLPLPFLCVCHCPLTLRPASATARHLGASRFLLEHQQHSCTETGTTWFTTSLVPLQTPGSPPTALSQWPAFLDECQSPAAPQCSQPSSLFSVL